MSYCYNMWDDDWHDLSTVNSKKEKLRGYERRSFHVRFSDGHETQIVSWSPACAADEAEEQYDGNVVAVWPTSAHWETFVDETLL